MHVATAAFLLALGSPARADHHTHADHDHGTPQGLQQHQEMMDQEAMMTDGEVRKVDKSAGKITLKHGPLPNLGMGAMTMVFRAKDPALLDQLKAGDRIRFRAESVNGALTITEASKAP
ncbi:MAG: copper-binding protein [Halothiobacillaceae bacterium]|nr:MAG: copper-binding protein [Halothiobacillaceae bacterium]